MLSFSNPILPSVDRSKDEYANALAFDNGTSNLMQVTQGTEFTWQEIQDQRHREKMRALQLEAEEMRERVKLGLPLLNAPTALPATEKQDDKQAEEEQPAAASATARHIIEAELVNEITDKKPKQQEQS